MLRLRAAVGSLLSFLLLFSLSSFAQTTVSPNSLSFGSIAQGNSSASKNVNTAELYGGSTMLTGIQITPQNPTLSSSGWMQFRLVGTFADGSTQALSVIANWAAADPTILYMDGHSGNANGNGVTGTTSVTAQFAGFAASTTVTVQ